MNVIPILASCGLSGFESPAQEYQQLPLSLDDLLIEHPSATFIGRASGDSLQGVGIFDGDVLIVDRHVTARQNDVVVLVHNGAFAAKILDISGRRLYSAHPAYPPVAIADSDRLIIEGVVIRSIRLHRPSCRL